MQNHSLMSNQWTNSPCRETCVPVCFFSAWFWMLCGGILDRRPNDALNPCGHKEKAARHCQFCCRQSRLRPSPETFERHGKFDLRRGPWKEGEGFLCKAPSAFPSPWSAGRTWPPSALCVAWQHECEEWLVNGWLITLSFSERDEVRALL